MVALAISPIIIQNASQSRPYGPTIGRRYTHYHTTIALCHLREEESGQCAFGPTGIMMPKQATGQVSEQIYESRSKGDGLGMPGISRSDEPAQAMA